MRGMTRFAIRNRSRRWPTYIGVVCWGSLLWFFGFVGVQSGGIFGVAFVLMFLVLFAVCLWFYGVLPISDRRGSTPPDHDEFRR